jgi:hypothetical protein
VDRLATASFLPQKATFPHKNQCARRRLTRPQGAIGYDGHNEGKGAKKRELA